MNRRGQGPTIVQWLQGARLRTLPMALSPVIIGSAAAYGLSGFKPVNALLALIVALLLQIGVNYANDYSDGIRGTDDQRVGPLRLTGSGTARPEQVKTVAFTCFAVAMLAGLVLVLLSHAWWLLLVGLACVLAAWGYTGGRNPYGYLGLGDVFVFVFFGLVATLGTTFTQAGRLSWEALLGAVSTGLIAVALLMANNVRDLPGDTQSGKRTLAVRLGDRNARRAYVAMLALAIVVPLFLVVSHPWVLLIILIVPATLQPSWVMLAGKSRKALIPVLQQTGMINLGFSLLYSAALVLDRGF